MVFLWDYRRILGRCQKLLELKAVPAESTVSSATAPGGSSCTQQQDRVERRGVLQQPRVAYENAQAHQF